MTKQPPDGSEGSQADDGCETAEAQQDDDDSDDGSGGPPAPLDWDAYVDCRHNGSSVTVVWSADPHATEGYTVALAPGGVAAVEPRAGTVTHSFTGVDPSTDSHGRRQRRRADGPPPHVGQALGGRLRGRVRRHHNRRPLETGKMTANAADGMIGRRLPPTTNWSPNLSVPANR